VDTWAALRPPGRALGVVVFLVVSPRLPSMSLVGCGSAFSLSECPLPRYSRPMKKIRVGVIGFGLSGKVFHARVLSSVPGFELATVVTSRAKEVREEFPATGVVSSAQELLDDPSIDLVVITTPNELHAPLAVSALEAGKHVVVEKPFVVTSAEGRAVVECAKRMNRVLSVYHNRRWDNGFLTLRRAIDEGRLGKIYLYEARFERFRPTTRSERWREQPHGGSGVLFDLGSHLIDQALSLFGKPQGVYCDLAAQRPGSVVDDYFHVLMDYGDLRVVLASGCVVGVPGPVLSVHGDKGTFIKRSLDPQEDALKEGLSPDTVDSWGLDGDEAQLFVSSETGVATPLPYPTIPGSYHHFYEGVYSAIVEGAASPVSGDDGVAVIEIVEACLRSNTERRWVALS